MEDSFDRMMIKDKLLVDTVALYSGHPLSVQFALHHQLHTLEQLPTLTLYSKTVPNACSSHYSTTFSTVSCGSSQQLGPSKLLQESTEGQRSHI